MRPARSLFFAFSLFQLCFAQEQEPNIPTNYSAQHYLSLSSTFTDSARYNSYDFAGNPLGKLDSDTNLVALQTGYRFLHLTRNAPVDSSYNFNGFVIPVITLRPSPSVLLSFNYSLNSIESDSLSMPVHQFGFMMLSQANKGIFKGGIAGQGFIGTEKQSDGSDTRTLMGIKDMGICIGSSVSPFVNLGLFAHAAFLLDTLSSSTNNVSPLQERFASVQLPQIDVTADINLPKASERAGISYTYAKRHFVLTQKSESDSAMRTFHDIAGDNGDDHEWDADPIVNDSMAFALQNMWKINFENNMALMPSFAIGYMRNQFKRMKPSKDNQPLSYDGQKDGYEWQTRSFRFGVGTKVQIFDLSTVWVEFSRSSLNLSLDGEKFADSLKDSKSKGFYRLGLGTQFNFARIPGLNISKSTDIALSVGYLYDEQNDLISSYRGETFSNVLPMAVNTQLSRYTPWKQFREKISSSGIHTGLHTSFKDQTFMTDLYFVFFNQSITGENPRKGKEIETGLDFTYNLKARSQK
jgi:hypothetical protein